MQELHFDQKLVADMMDHRRSLAPKCEKLFKTRKSQELLTQLKKFLNGQLSVALLLGPKSSGKTTLLHLLQGEIKHCHYFLADSKVDVSDYLWRQDDFTEDQCVIIDDAGSLSLTNFEKLLLHPSTQQTGKIKLILVGDVFLQQRMEELQEKNSSISFQKFVMPSLTLKEATAYLRENLPSLIQNQVSAYPQCTKKTIQKLTFPSSSVIQKLYDLSEGYIGRINRVALQFALNPKNIKHVKTKKNKAFIDTVLTGAICVSLILVAMRIGLIIFAGKERHALAPVAQKITVSASPTHPQTKVYVEEILPDYIPSIANLSEEKLILTNNTIVNLNATNLSLPIPALLQNPSTHYTIQLLVSSKKQDLLTLMNGSHLKRAHKILPIENNGEHSFILTYGTFNSVHEAEKVLQRLPTRYQDNHPTVQPLDTSHS